MGCSLSSHSLPERKAWVSKYGGQAFTHAADPPPPPPPPPPRCWNGPLERRAPIHVVPVTSQELPERCCIQPQTALGFVGWLLNVPATCECISWTNLLDCTCCHTEIEVTDQTFHLTQSQYTDTGPTSPSTDPITPGAWQGSHWNDSTPETSRRHRDSNPESSALEADA